jgi:hypothetical protein
MEARAAAKQMPAFFETRSLKTGTVDTLAQDFRILSGFGLRISTEVGPGTA